MARDIKSFGMFQCGVQTLKCFWNFHDFFRAWRIHTGTHVHLSLTTISFYVRSGHVTPHHHVTLIFLLYFTPQFSIILSFSWHTILSYRNVSSWTITPNKSHSFDHILRLRGQQLTQATQRNEAPHKVRTFPLWIRS